MKKHVLLYTNLSICLVMVAALLFMEAINLGTYNKVLTDNIETTANLASSTICAQINSELAKPVYVAQAMANDTFLKDWIRGEQAAADEAAYREKLQQYLNAFRQTYNFDSVFMVSAYSGIYYYPDGVNKTVSRQDAHDAWYYDFIESGQAGTLDVSTDEPNANELTVFVNCRIEDTDRTLLGVVGAGIKTSQLQALLRSYGDEYALEAFLIDKTGLVQAHAETSFIKSTNFFDNENAAASKASILGNLTGTEVNWYQEDGVEQCVITRYIDDLGWYLVVRKDTASIRRSFTEFVMQDMLVGGIVVFVLLGISTCVIRRYDRITTRMASVDELTGLPNRKAFSHQFQKLPSGDKQVHLFIFDIDRFKALNDTRGHMYGDAVLAGIGRIAARRMEGQGIIARWGGDEFVGLVYGTHQSVQKLLAGLMEEITGAGGLGDVSVSMGVTQVHGETRMEKALERADRALYASKRDGGNRITNAEDVQ